MKPVNIPGRPGFPVSLKPAGKLSIATKSIATSSRPHWTGGVVDVKNDLQRPVPAGLGLDSQAVRARMVQKLGSQGVADARVLAAMGLVERHRFVDSALVNQAYEDTSLPIGLGQTISKPNVVARMLELILAGETGKTSKTGKLGRVLEIGTGCGYQAALLGQIVVAPKPLRSHSA